MTKDEENNMYKLGGIILRCRFYFLMYYLYARDFSIVGRIIYPQKNVNWVKQL